MSYPLYKDIEAALLLHIFRNGGEVYSDSTYKPLADQFGLSHYERQASRDDIFHDGRREPKWNNMVQWARRSLKDHGFLDDMAEYGHWKLSEAGIRAAERQANAQA